MKAVSKEAAFFVRNIWNFMLAKKLKLIYLPFLLVSVSFTVFYLFLYWLLFIQAQLFSVSREDIRFWLPLILAVIPVLFWLYPKVKLLDINALNGRFIFQALLVWAIGFPALFINEYFHGVDKEMNREYSEIWWVLCLAIACHALVFICLMLAKLNKEAIARLEFDKRFSRKK